MLKHTPKLLLVIYIATAVLIAGSLAAIDSAVLPFLYTRSPKLLKIQRTYPYLIDIVVDFIEIVVALYIASKAPVFEGKLQKILRRRTALFDVIESLRFAADTGYAFFDIDGRIIGSTKLMYELAEKNRSGSIIGVRYNQIYSDSLTRIISELIDKAKYTKTVAVLDIPDWSVYSSKNLGPAILYVTPSYADAQYLGGSIVIRSTADVRSAENSSIYYRMHYSILFDTLPIGVAVFRPSVASDGGVDGYMLSANPAMRKILEGIPLPFTESCAVVWPSFINQLELRAAISAAITGGNSVREEFFSPALGKHLEAHLAQLPGGRMLCILLDQTELRMNEKNVLGLSDQLQRTITTHAIYMSRVLEDIQNFNQATADMVEAHLDELKELAQKLPDNEAAVVTATAGGLYKCLSQMLRYHNVGHLPFKETVLLFPSEVVTRLLEPLGNRFPEVAFSVGSLPGVVSNREVLTNILEQLMVTLAGLPVDAAPGRIEVSSQPDFLTTNITVSGWGFDTSPVFLETPGERQALDWMLTSDLDLATVRSMVAKHGGELFIGPTPDGAGVELSFSIGSPA